MVALFQPQITELILKRDQVVAQWQLTHAGQDVYEDRDLELTSELDVSVEDQMSLLRESLSAS